MGRHVRRTLVNTEARLLRSAPSRWPEGAPAPRSGTHLRASDGGRAHGITVSGFERNAYVGARRGDEKGDSARSLLTPMRRHQNTPSPPLARGSPRPFRTNPEEPPDVSRSHGRCVSRKDRHAPSRRRRARRARRPWACRRLVAGGQKPAAIPAGAASRSWELDLQGRRSQPGASAPSDRLYSERAVPRRRHRQGAEQAPDEPQGERRHVPGRRLPATADVAPVRRPAFPGR